MRGILATAGLLLAPLVIGALALRNPAPAHFADPTDLMLVSRGRHLYAERCAACHGRNLQGQPLWQLTGSDQVRRAPALDATGHAWQRSDDALFSVVQLGHSVSAGSGFDDPELFAIIAFIKARWPPGLRAVQALLNPGHVGLPAATKDINWTLPAGCGAAS